MAALSYYMALPFCICFQCCLFAHCICYQISFVFFIPRDRLSEKVVFDNLRNAFPDKTDSEINAIRIHFYHYFCDLFLETFKTLTISRDSMLKHCSMDPAAEALFNGFAAENKSIVVVMGHYGNWEWAGNTFSLRCKHQLYVIYHPLRNPYFNRLTIKMRTRFGTKLIAMKDTFRDMVQNRGHLSATAFIADQTPSPDKAYWMNFLNQDTPVFPVQRGSLRK